MIWCYSFLIFFWSINIINCERLPPDIPLCKSEDIPCIIKTANDLIRRFPNGRPDMNIPQYDPFYVKNVELNFPGGNAIDMHMKLKDVNVIGMSTQTFDKAVGFTKNPSTSKFELYARIPKLEFNGNYKANGRILVLPFQGDGKFKIILKDVKASVKFKPTVFKKKDGLTYLKVDKIKFLLDPTSVRMKFDNLFNGNKQLGDSMNSLINENWRDLWVEFAPPTYEVAEKIIKDVTTGIFEKYNYDNIYLD